MERRSFLKLSAVTVTLGAMTRLPAVSALATDTAGVRLELVAEPTSEGGMLTRLRLFNGSREAIHLSDTEKIQVVARSLDTAGLVGKDTALAPVEQQKQVSEGRWEISLPQPVSPGQSVEIPLTWHRTSRTMRAMARETIQVFASAVLSTEPFYEIQSPEVVLEL